MSGISIKAIAGLIVYAVICFCATLAFVQCSEKQAQERVDKASMDAEAIRCELKLVREENEKLREIILRANEAVNKAISLMTEAKQKHEQRIEIIESDPESIDWLTCDLPASVRDAFKDYCSDED